MLCYAESRGGRIRCDLDEGTMLSAGQDFSFRGVEDVARSGEKGRGRGERLGADNLIFRQASPLRCYTYVHNMVHKNNAGDVC